MINHQTLIIHKFKSLFNILFEIKNVLNFKIIEDNEDNSIIHYEEKNLLIISGEKKIKKKNLIYIDEFPISLSKLIELININFVKNKYNAQNNIKIGNYYINFNSRMINKDNLKLSLTEKEIKIINYLNISKKAVTISDLQSEVWGHKSKLETHTVETHVYRLRKKMEKIFKDNSFILSLKKGYKINA